MNMEILKKIRPLRMNGVSLPEIRRLKGVQNAFDFLWRHAGGGV